MSEKERVLKQDLSMSLSGNQISSVATYDAKGRQTSYTQGSSRTVTYNLLDLPHINDGLVYGHVTLKRYPNNTVRAFADNYSFEMHNWKNPSNWGRNAETVIGNRVAGEGTRYEINVYGSKRIKPILPWIK